MLCKPLKINPTQTILFAVCFLLALFASYLSALQDYGDLNSYKYVYETYGSQIYSFPVFYSQSNLYTNILDIGYALVLYLVSKIVPFDTYIFISAFLFFFSFTLLLSRCKSALFVAILISMSFITLYPWALASNLDKLKLSLTSYFVILNLITGKNKASLGDLSMLLLIPPLFHASTIIISTPSSILLYLSYNYNPSTSLHDFSQYQPMLPNPSALKSYLLRAKILVLFSSLFLLFLLYVTPRLSVYFSSYLKPYDVLSSLYFSLVIFYVFLSPSTTLSTFSLSKYGAVFGVFALITFLSLAYVITMYRVNVLLFFFVLSFSNLIPVKKLPLLVFVLLPFCLTSSFALFRYIMSSYYDGYGYAFTL